MKVASTLVEFMTSVDVWERATEIELLDTLQISAAVIYIQAEINETVQVQADKMFSQCL